MFWGTSISDVICCHLHGVVPAKGTMSTLCCTASSVVKRGKFRWSESPWAWSDLSYQSWLSSIVSVPDKDTVLDMRQCHSTIPSLAAAFEDTFALVFQSSGYVVIKPSNRSVASANVTLYHKESRLAVRQAMFHISCTDGWRITRMLMGTWWWWGEVSIG